LIGVFFDGVGTRSWYDAAEPSAPSRCLVDKAVADVPDTPDTRRAASEDDESEPAAEAPPIEVRFAAAADIAGVPATAAPPTDVRFVRVGAAEELGSVYGFI
jgi:hypothetical protein